MLAIFARKFIFGTVFIGIIIYTIFQFLANPLFYKEVHFFVLIFAAVVIGILDFHSSLELKNLVKQKMKIRERERTFARKKSVVEQAQKQERERYEKTLREKDEKNKQNKQAKQNKQGANQVISSALKSLQPQSSQRQSSVVTPQQPQSFEDVMRMWQKQMEKNGTKVELNNLSLTDIVRGLRSMSEMQPPRSDANNDKNQQSR